MLILHKKRNKKRNKNLLFSESDLNIITLLNPKAFKYHLGNPYPMLTTNQHRSGGFIHQNHHINLDLRSRLFLPQQQWKNDNFPRYCVLFDEDRNHNPHLSYLRREALLLPIPVERNPSFHRRHILRRQRCMTIVGHHLFLVFCPCMRGIYLKLFYSFYHLCIVLFYSLLYKCLHYYSQFISITH